MRVFLPRLPIQSLKDVVKPSYGSSKQTFTVNGDKEWPRSYEMMLADDIPLTEPRPNDSILAERGEANKLDLLGSTFMRDSGAPINVQKESIVR